MCQGISAPLAFACYKGDQLRKPNELSMGRACAFASRARNCAKGDPVVVAQDPVIVAGASRARIFAKGLPEVVAEYAVIDVIVMVAAATALQTRTISRIEITIIATHF